MSKEENEAKWEHPEVMEEVYRQYLKGTIMETKLAFRTARDHIIDQLKIKFDIFFNELKKEEIL